MSFLDDLPQRPSGHVIAKTAEQVFEDAITQCRHFQMQTKDQKDYGTDYQLEALDGSKVTNFRVHVQLKGTKKPLNADGSLSVTAERDNLNYLLADRDSIYVGYHVPSKQLLVRFASDVYRDYERQGKDWRTQKGITVRCTVAFDNAFQERLAARTIANGRSDRDRRLRWNVTPPDQISTLINTTVQLVEVPPNSAEAAAVLNRLYQAGRDDVISASFTRFQAVLGTIPGSMDTAYMSEINLAINHAPFDRQRVIDGREALLQAMGRKQFHPGGLLYCLGNACLALSEFQNAKAMFVKALECLNNENMQLIAAQCCKNLGAALEGLDDHANADLAYEKALEFDADLPQAHYAIATRLIQKGGDLSKALSHLEAITPRTGGVPMSSVQARRVEVYFQLGDTAAAFREVNNILESRSTSEWVWPFSAGQVARFGRISADAAARSLRFWREYLAEQPDDLNAKRELVMCFVTLQSRGRDAGVAYGTVKDLVIELVDAGDAESAFLWDRLGHWAQVDGKWEEAVSAFREAYNREPDREYGYCLGTALNHIGRYQEALAVLVPQAERYQPDAMSWFQVGVARTGVEDFAGAIDAFGKAVQMDCEYDHALFNLGGAYWNAGRQHEAIRIWKDAIHRFPSHPKVDELRTRLGQYLV